MKEITFTGTIENARNRKFSPALEYTAKYQELETLAEVQAANEMPNDDDLIAVANNKRKAAARGKASNSLLDAMNIPKPTIQNDEQMRLRKMFDLYVSNGKTPEEAKTLASSSLGIAWAD